MPPPGYNIDEVSGMRQPYIDQIGPLWKKPVEERVDEPGGGIKQFFWPTSDVPGAVAPIVYPSKLIVATLLAFSVIVALTTVLLSASADIEAAMTEVAKGVEYVVSAAEMTTSFPAVAELTQLTCATVNDFKDAPEMETTLTEYCNAVLSTGPTGGANNPIYFKLFVDYVLPDDSTNAVTAAASAFAAQVPVIQIFRNNTFIYGAAQLWWVHSFVGAQCSSGSHAATGRGARACSCSRPSRI